MDTAKISETFKDLISLNAAKALVAFGYNKRSFPLVYTENGMTMPTPNRQIDYVKENLYPAISIGEAFFLMLSYGVPGSINFERTPEGRARITVSYEASLTNKHLQTIKVSESDPKETFEEEFAQVFNHVLIAWCAGLI